MTTPAVDLATDCLAAYRLTRLVQRDTFPPVKAARDAIVHEGSPDWLWEVGKDCAWCGGFWVAVAVVIARRKFPRLWSPLATALAASAVTGLVTQYELLAHAETEHA